MAEKITRRSALLAGTATAGSLLGASCINNQPSGTTDKQSMDQAPLKNVWGEDFLMQWSPPDNLTRDLVPGNTHIRLSCSAHRMHYPKEGESFGSIVKSIRDAGYTACETGSRGFEKVTDSEIKEMNSALKEHDVQFYTIHAWANLLDPDPQKQSDAIRHYIESIELAERFGLGFILTHTGGRSGEAKDRPHPLNWTKESWEMSVNNIKEVLKNTSGSKIALAFEAVNSCNNNTPQSHVRLKEDVGDDRVKVMLDPSNMLHAGTMFRTTELINECFDLLGEDIMYAHAKDQTWSRMMPSIEGAILGEGTMDYETYLVRLSRMKYPRVLLLEHLPLEQYPPSKKYLEDTAAKLGVKIYS
ncbi:MAG: sugar phosphate isomerase/epimerase [Candidatus Latescibacteria bacterium]|nr:sugar phosphate isomerase/epimerase [Candidatus Latescibacterota bacterium]